MHITYKVVIVTIVGERFSKNEYRGADDTSAPILPIRVFDVKYDQKRKETDLVS